VLVLGDQLSRSTGALARAEPGTDRVVMVESAAKLAQRPWHRQKLVTVLSAMRHFAAELETIGFDVSYRYADDLQSGLSDVEPENLAVMAPSSYGLRRRLARWGVEQVENDAYIVTDSAFRRWAEQRQRLTLEDFYREVRREHGWLMDGDQPLGAQWNFDPDNRQRPPAEGVSSPRPYQPTEDELDTAVHRDLAEYTESLGLSLSGADHPRWLPATRREALSALHDFLDNRLETFGAYQDAVIGGEPVLWHSVLSAPLNLGLLHPAEVCDAVDARYRASGGPINSYEGFLRQVCGWREYVWGLYWLRMPTWRDDNVLGHHGPVPGFYWDGATDMQCLAATLGDLHHWGWTHHIPRLMLLGNYALLAGVDPLALTDWFHANYVDGYEWVMVPNVVGMSQWADGGVMATKPYAAAANYINKMTDYCDDCVYNPKTRTEEDSCPFNALYWDFLSRHRSQLAANHRIRPLLSNLDRFDENERAGITERAAAFRTDVQAPSR
jgi:deoxyribodipyrimidine photolyase-related protein